MKETVVDLYGGDNKIEDMLEGAVSAVKEDENLTVILPLLESDKTIFAKMTGDVKDRIKIIEAGSVLCGEDNPVKAAVSGADYTITKGIEYVKNNPESSLLTVGNTAAALILAMSKIGLQEKVKKPVLAALLPRYGGDMFCLLDCGANLKVTSEELMDFAYLGAGCIEKTFNKNNVRVGLLSVGAEDRKGTDTVIKANELLRDSDLNFIGNVEPDMIFESDVDVVVCDGFAGNMILKNTEATGNYLRRVFEKINAGLKDQEASNISHEDKAADKMMLEEQKAIKTSQKSQKISNVESKCEKICAEIWNNMEHFYRFNDYGGAVFLGIKCNIIKAHGKANAETIKNCIELVKRM